MKFIKIHILEPLCPNSHKFHWAKQEQQSFLKFRFKAIHIPMLLAVVWQEIFPCTFLLDLSYTKDGYMCHLDDMVEEEILLWYYCYFLNLLLFQDEASQGR